MTAQEILDFWFGTNGENARAEWFEKTPQFDAEIRDRFYQIYQRAAAAELSSWLEIPSQALALVILLDQFPRNMFRNSSQMFATDRLALDYAKRAIDVGHDQALPPIRRIFFYLPFEHSEDLADQERSVDLFAKLADEIDDDTYYEYAIKHRDIIRRFGRFPHRNSLLQRCSTDAEEKFVASTPGF
jgi:uncharacterized protein (DUF924 family)